VLSSCHPPPGFAIMPTLLGVCMQPSTPADGRRRLCEEAPVHLLLLLLACITLNHGATLTVGHSYECRDVMA